jgi:hypothetical protein
MENIPSKKMVWTGRALSTLVSLPLIFSAIMKLSRNPEVYKGMAHLGLPESMVVPLGILELACVIVYVIPQTAVIGAILLTGYIGGAMLTHLRIGEGVPIHIVLGIVIWLGIWLREPRLRTVLPLRKLKENNVG